MGKGRRVNGVKLRWEGDGVSMYSLRRQVHLFLTQTPGREGFNCDFWEYKETGVPLDGRRDRKRPWLLTILESLTCYDPEGG